MKKIVNIFILICLIIIILRCYFLDYQKVVGESMLDTLHENDIILFNKISKRYERFDIVVVRKEYLVVKRIIGLPGDTIECKDGIIYINNEAINESYVKGITSDFDKIKIADNQYFVLGDNREHSVDSRDYGSVRISEIIGRVIKIF